MDRLIYVYVQKISYNGGSYMSGHFSQVYPAGQPIMGANTLMPMYPLYHYHQSHTMGLPAHMFPPTTTGAITTVPAAIMPKPASIAPNSGRYFVIPLVIFVFFYFWLVTLNMI